MSAPHERDQVVERLLRESFNTLPQELTDACLDAETLAAWVDGGLPADAAGIARAHVTGCARCQAMAAVLVRTSAIVPAPEPSPRRWLGWLVPLTAAAAAVAIWVAVPRPRATPTSITTDAGQAAKPTEPTPLPATPDASTSADKNAEPARETKEAFAPRERAAGAVEGLAKKDEATTDLRRDAGRQEVDRLEAQQKAAAPFGALADTTTPSAPPPAALAAPAAVASRAEAVSAERAAANALEVVSPDPGVRWRMAGPIIERSVNRGATWSAVPVPVASELLAGAAPSATVCWIVGRDGVVLRTTDGVRFSRVPFPDTMDLTAVRAADARSASVTAADGRTFSTADAGATWTQP